MSALILIAGILLIFVKFLAMLGMNIPTLSALSFIQWIANAWYLWIVGFAIIGYMFIKNLYILGGIILIIAGLMYFGGFI